MGPSSVKFWVDDWVPNEVPLMNVITDPSLDTDISCPVNEFRNAEGSGIYLSFVVTCLIECA